MRHPVLTLDDICANLRAVRRDATPTQVADGRAWYPEAGRMIAGIARQSFDHTGEAVSKSFACGVFAAYSMNQGWKGNCTIATRYLFGSGPTGLQKCRREIERLEDGMDPADAIIYGLKRQDFYRNLMGLHTYVTCDRWHLRAAYGRDNVKLTPTIRTIVTKATRIIAREFGESASACQAVIWCAIRGDGK